MVDLTTTYYKIKAMKTRIKLIQGGQGAGKNWAIAIYLLERALEGALTITIITDTYDNLKDGPLEDFEKIFEMQGYNVYDYYNKQEKVLYWGESKIQLRYAADHKPQKGKGPRRDILYVNEGNKMGWNAIKHYIARSGEVLVDFNPDMEFWAHKRLLPKDNASLIIVTWRDNERCPEHEVEYIEERKDNVEWYRVYGLGQIGTYSDRRIYQFTIVDSIPPTAKRIPSGMDFGVSPDQTCLVDHYVDGADLYWDEVFCENNLMPEKIKGAERQAIVDRMDELAMLEVRAANPDYLFPLNDEYYLGYDPSYEAMEYSEESYQEDLSKATDQDRQMKAEVAKIKNWQIVGDISGATEMRDLYMYGYNIRGVKKPKGSQDRGIKRLRSYNHKVLRHSVNVKDGMENWFWKQDKNGENIPEPDGHEPDCLAAGRYVQLAKAVW